jgi:hypothetical protein
MDIVIWLFLLPAVIVLLVFVAKLRDEVDELKRRVSDCEWKNKSLESTIGSLRDHL